MAFHVMQILVCITAIIFGIIVGNFTTRTHRCFKISIPTERCQDMSIINDINLRNTNLSKPSNIFPSQEYFLAAYNHSFPISWQRNLVITAAVNSNLTIVYRFSRSARASCVLCLIVIIVTNATMYNNDFKELADLYSIIYISVEEYFSDYTRVYRSNFRHIHSTRWIIMKNYLFILRDKGEVFDNVFICDSHDTVFQTDVFQHMIPYTPGLYAFIEDIRMTIGTSSANHDWVKTCYGRFVVEKLFNKSISCSGTVLGTWSAVLSYLSVMESEILKTPVACRNSVGSDQGVHNYIIYYNKVPNVTIHHISNEYGFVGTLGYALSLTRNQFGLVQNANRSAYAVIHQWNRHKQMNVQFQREYQLIPSDMRDKRN